MAVVFDFLVRSYCLTYLESIPGINNIFVFFQSQNTLSILCDMNKSNTQRSNKSQRDFGVQVGESFCLTNETAISRNEDTLEETLYSDENSQEMRCHQKSITGSTCSILHLNCSTLGQL